MIYFTKEQAMSVIAAFASHLLPESAVVKYEIKPKE